MPNVHVGAGGSFSCDGITELRRSRGTLRAANTEGGKRGEHRLAVAVVGSAGLSYLPKLKVLNLSYNYITAITADELRYMHVLDVRTDDACVFEYYTSSFHKLMHLLLFLTTSYSYFS